MEYDKLRKVEPDQFKINSIRKVADARLRAIRQITKDSETSSIIVEGYYEIIKELLTAFLLKNGLKANDHENLINYFKEQLPEFEYEAMKIHQLKNIRNRLNYEGIFIKPEYLGNNEAEFIHIIDLINKFL